MSRTAAGSLAGLLKQYRTAAGLTQEELAERANLSARAISDLERGIKHRPYPHTLRQLVQALRLDEEKAASFQRAAWHGGAAGNESRAAERVERRLSLPMQATPFIGRQHEVQELRTVLGREDVRLLTLTGPGGVGKTRLALQVAEGVAARFPDGMVFVSLASLADPEFVPATVASVLGITEGIEQPIRERLIAHLHGKRLLLILDNFEHLLPSADVLSELLAFCPQLKLLVTSRAILHLAPEHEYPVPPLAVPTPGHLPDRDVLSRYDAVQLFVQRAQAVKLGFVLTDENASVVAEICSRLDGLPLAIELAATRIKLFSPHALQARLEHRLPMLTGGARDLPRRQQTMQKTVAWSYELLSEQEQTLFRRLSVFAGGCTAQAAEAVCNGASDLERDVLAGLESLVDQSLLVVAEQWDGEPRFLMLETIREYALERLEASGEAEDLRQRHAEAYVELAERAEQALANTDASTWWTPFERERDNVFLALRWSLEREETADLTVRLAGVLARVWIERGYSSEGHWWIEHPGVALFDMGTMRGYSSEGHWWIEQVVPLCMAQRLAEVYPRACAQILTAAAFLARGHADIASARLYGERSVELWRRCHDMPGLAFALRGLGQTAMERGDHALARSLLEERVELIRGRGASQERIWALHDRGQMELRQGNLQTARSILEGAVELAQVSGGTRNVMHLQAVLADLACSQNDLVAARAFHEAALAKGRKTFASPDEWMNLQAVLVNAARRARRLGDYEQAIALCEENLSLARSECGTARERDTAWGLNHLADGHRCQGDNVRAAALYEESLALFREQGDSMGIASMLHNLGHVALSEGETLRARVLFTQSLSLFQELDFAWGIAHCVAGLAGVWAHKGNAERAALLFGAAEAAHHALDASGNIEPANELAWKREIAAARGKIDVGPWENAWSAGQALSLDQALARADRAKD